MWKQKAKHPVHSLFTPAITPDKRATCWLKAVHCGCIKIPSGPSSLSAALLEYIWAALYKSCPQPNTWMRITSGCSVNLTHTAFTATLGLLCGIPTLPFCHAPQCCPYSKVYFLFAEFPAYQSKAALYTNMQKEQTETESFHPNSSVIVPSQTHPALHPLPCCNSELELLLSCYSENWNCSCGVTLSWNCSCAVTLSWNCSCAVTQSWNCSCATTLRAGIAPVV